MQKILNAAIFDTPFKFLTLNYAYGKISVCTLWCSVLVFRMCTSNFA